MKSQAVDYFRQRQVWSSERGRGLNLRDDEPRDFVWAGARTLDPVSTTVHVESNQDDLMARKFQVPIITVNGSWFAKERG